MDEKNNNRRSPAFDLEALSKAYEQSLNDVTLGGKNIPTPERKRPVPRTTGTSELKSFVPEDFRPQKEGDAEHDKIVDKIRAERRKRSHSVWTDNPILKPKKSVWIDDGDEPAPARRTPSYSAPTYSTSTAARKIEAAQQKPAEKPAPKQLPPDFIAPLPVMTHPPKPEPIPDFGAVVESAMDKPRRDSVVPILNEKPRKQELLMNVDRQGDTSVQEMPHRVNKQKVTVDMSGYDNPNKKTVSLKMPISKMNIDDLKPVKKPVPEKTETKAETVKPETKAEPKPEARAEEKTQEMPAIPKKAVRSVKPADNSAQKKAPAAAKTSLEKPAKTAVQTDKAAAASVNKAAPSEKTSLNKPSKTAASNKPKATPDEKAERVIDPDMPTAEKTFRKRPETEKPKSREEIKAKLEEAMKSEPTKAAKADKAAKTNDDEGYDFSGMINKVRSEKKDKVREEYSKGGVSSHTLITEKAQRRSAEPQHTAPKKKSTKKKKPKTHELEFSFINCIMCLCLVFGIFFSLLFMERESGFINSENRNLATFPEFSVSDYFKGKFTKGICDYFTDTIPGREDLKKFGAAYDRCKGIDLGGAKVSGTHKTAEKETLDEEKLAAVTTVTANTDPKAATTTTATSDGKQTTTTTEKEEVVELPEILDDGVMEGDVIVFGKGKEVRAVAGYYGQFETGALYAQTINKYKEAMPEINVYNMTIPTSAAYYMPNNFKDSVADQKDNIDNIASELSGIINVDVYDALKAHTGEYIYSRTDHHWEPLGAYYAGKVFAEKAGVKYADLKTYEKCQIEGFLGTMYAYSNYDSELEANPDTFIYYKPDNQYTTKYYDTDFTNGEEGSLFFDFAEGVNCYSAILGQDEEITEITTDVDNGRTLVIFKDSFGNALVPFFTHSFEKIYVCDFRYFDENAVEFCRAVGCTDLLFSISITSCSTEMHITAINNNRVQDSANPLTQQEEPAESKAESTESQPEGDTPEQNAQNTQDNTESKADGNNNDELGG